MEKFEEKMKKAGLSKAAIDAFRVNYEQLTGGATGMVGNFCIDSPSATRDCRPIALFRPSSAPMEAAKI